MEKQKKEEIKREIDKKEIKVAETGNEMSIKEERIRRIILLYYSRPDIRKAMFEFSKNRECVPRYFEGFGKRPDGFQYDSDILELAKKGATSFHCSEELWQDPLELSTAMREDEIKKLRIGWDLLLDIDCKYPEYSKKAAKAIILAMKQSGVNNVNLKFSGSKGFHVIIPWKAFPEELSGKKTREMFPEWPRLICQYLKEKSRDFLEKDLYSSEDANVLGKLKKGIRCEKCKNMSEKAELVHFICGSCKTKMENLTKSFERKRKIRCPNCQREMEIQTKDTLYQCTNCGLDSRKNPENFNEGFEHIDVFEVLGLDVILVSPRHLFRMPYSLHEKTALASVVVPFEKLDSFDMLRDADPMKVIPLNFMPNSKPGEATELLRDSLEFKPIKKAEEKIEKAEYEKRSGEKQKTFADIDMLSIPKDFYPPTIKKILEGMKTDGRKRALFILISFFSSIKMPMEEIKKIIDEWDKKNIQPLREGYIRAQLSWYSKQKETKLPPNFDKSYYKDIGVNPSQEELELKNPINYLKKKYFDAKRMGKLKPLARKINN